MASKKPAKAPAKRPAKPVPRVRRAEPEERQVTVSFLVPEAVHFDLKVRAAMERTTVRGMVLRALKEFGLAVPEAETSDRRPGRAGRPKGRSA